MMNSLFFDKFRTNYPQTLIYEIHNPTYIYQVICEASAPLTQDRVFCPNCDRKFIDSSSLQRHIAFRHFPKKTARLMNLTPISSNLNLSGLNECSILTVHEETKPYKCSSRNAAFSRRYHLNRHVSGVHENKKPFQCGTCLIKFLEEHELKRHIFAVHEKKKLHRSRRALEWSTH